MVRISLSGFFKESKSTPEVVILCSCRYFVVYLCSIVYKGMTSLNKNAEKTLRQNVCHSGVLLLSTTTHGLLELKERNYCLSKNNAIKSKYSYSFVQLKKLDLSKLFFFWKHFLGNLIQDTSSHIS